MKTAVLIGNYGVGNLGDEALRDYFLETFPDVSWQVLSAHPLPGEYPRLPFGIRSLFSPWWRTLLVMRKADAVVFGGGSLFTDTESVKACFLWWWHAAWARVWGTPVLLAFQGIGPFHSKVGERLARWVCQKAAFLSVRDEASKRRVDSWGLNRNVIQSFDPVFSLTTEKKHMVRTQDVLMVVPRHNSGNFLLEATKTSVAAHPDARVRIVLLQPDHPEEQERAQELCRLFPSATVQSVATLAELRDAIAEATMMVSERYHASLFAFGLGCPQEIVWQKEGDKLWELARMIGQGMHPGTCLALVAAGRDAFRVALENVPQLGKMP